MAVVCRVEVDTDAAEGQQGRMVGEYRAAHGANITGVGMVNVVAGRFGAGGRNPCPPPRRGMGGGTPEGGQLIQIVKQTRLGGSDGTGGYRTVGPASGRNGGYC